jgi:hypothetical protein
LAFGGAYISTVVIPLSSGGRLKEFALKNNGDLREEIGWTELVEAVAGVRDSLPAEQRNKVGVLVGNYGEAGALHLFGPRYGLPSAISAHQNHYFWGPQGFTGDNLIVLEWGPRRIERLCRSGEILAEHYEPYGMEEENGPIYLCRGLKQPLTELWPRLKLWN